MVGSDHISRRSNAVPQVKVQVKWSGKKFDIDLDPAQPGLVFKTQLYTLTGVEPDRQKILIKGGTLKMMGTAGELPKAPETAVKFVEDMTETQLAKALKVPAGLVNLGNTCYMNATLQCLRAIPELRTAIAKANPSFGQDPRANLMPAIGNMFRDLENSGASFTPLVFLQILRSAFPQFNEHNNQGYFQQDAEECWGEIISSLADRVPGLSSDGDLAADKKFIEQYLSGETISTTKCDENPEEPPTTSINTFRQLKVNIGAGGNDEPSFAGFTEKIEKNSPSLGRSATYTQTTKITRLPAYLTINFVRFQWKPSERVKAKILKKVKFPFELDATPLCTPELVEKLSPAKMRLKKLEEEAADAKKKNKAVDGVDAMDVEKTAVTKDQQAVYKELGLDASLISDVGANVSGQYDLVAVLTHVGRAADSGHYIGWSKNEKGEWWKYDDDTVSLIPAEEISKLEGGGDWHSAYICLYKAKLLK
ncbi:Ubiquitin carboxyl-terminal hydrolase 14 [Irineochytrium annulatum]|nr:Ubiquitin carboxyl-terminal hydrolase 14 [Irineochytrium annulatum]